MVAYGRGEVQLHTLLTLHPCTLRRQTISWPLFEMLTFLFLHKISLAIKTGDSFTQYISWYPYFYGLLVFGITYPHSLALRGTLALYECVWSASHSTCFTVGENAVSTNWTGGWMGQRFGLKPCRSEKSLDPARNLTSITHLSIQATAYQPHQLHYHSYPIAVSLILNIRVTVVTDCFYSSHFSLRKKWI